MTIVNLDVKGLEVLVVAWLSKDKVLYRELNNNVDIHQANQDAFGLPSRLIAKVLKFRIIYGGTEYSFAQDPDFTSVSTSTKYWKNVIDRYYQKYLGIQKWHNEILTTVSKSGELVSPFGRTFRFDCRKYGEYKLPATQIKNWIVQGTGADIVSIARCSLYRRWKDAGIRGVLVNTVHDSILLDIHKDDVEKAIILLENVFKDLPININRIFGINWDLDIRVEILTGENMYALQ